ncbi:hypothetical protein [Calorimonas adulescens]|uniref:Uncharacterized protein n=1 Tax=Calorimonas adulescens TaxID=2606906 RepID=A0A5D8QH67_9THEO|nr:hypothetical protein [Calorimonas adulescens]TZE82903.1 hypothetical protein FWJ32_02815 [Calorimonas adulescens]
MPKEEHEIVRNDLIELMASFDELLNSMAKIEQDMEQKCLKHLVEKKYLEQAVNVIKKIQYIDEKQKELQRLRAEVDKTLQMDIHCDGCMQLNTDKNVKTTFWDFDGHNLKIETSRVNGRSYGSIVPYEIVMELCKAISSLDSEKQKCFAAKDLLDKTEEIIKARSGYKKSPSHLVRCVLHVMMDEGLIGISEQSPRKYAVLVKNEDIMSWAENLANRLHDDETSDSRLMPSFIETT